MRQQTRGETRHLDLLFSITESLSLFPGGSCLHENTTLFANGCLQKEVQGLQNQLSSTASSAKSGP